MRDPSIKLKIYSGLTLMKPDAGLGLSAGSPARSSSASRGLPGSRLYRGPETRRLPPNIEVHEFFFQAGAFLKAPLAQQR